MKPVWRRRPTEVEAAGGHALVIPTDVADHAQVDAAATQVEQAFGPIDVWVNDAFTSVFAPFGRDQPGRVSSRHRSQLPGLCATARWPPSRACEPRGTGAIVQVGSALGVRAIPLQSAYCGAKHAINGFTESLRTELMHDHSDIHVTVVQMPALNTPQFSWVLSRLPRHPQPVPPIYQPEVAARAIVHAADHPRRKTHWVGASTVATILGQHAVPAVLDRYLAKTGYASQQTGRIPLTLTGPTTCGDPLDGVDGKDHGAHGVFDDRALSTLPAAVAGRAHRPCRSSRPRLRQPCWPSAAPRWTRHRH